MEKYKEQEKYANFRGVSLEEVLKVEVNEGIGTKDDPMCRVIYYCDIETGEIIGFKGEKELRTFAGGKDLRKKSQLESKEVEDAIAELRGGPATFRAIEREILKFKTNIK